MAVISVSMWLHFLLHTGHVCLVKKEVYNSLRYSNVHLYIGANKILIPVYRHLQVIKSLFSIVYLGPQLQKNLVFVPLKIMMIPRNSWVLNFKIMSRWCLY